MTQTALEQTWLGEDRLEKVSCHLCGRNEGRFFLVGRGYSVVRCENCDFYYVDPQPSLEVLKKKYAIYHLETQWGAGEIQFGKRLVAIVRRFVRSGRVLDLELTVDTNIRKVSKDGYSIFMFTSDLLQKENIGKNVTVQFTKTKGKNILDNKNILNSLEIE